MSAITTKVDICNLALGGVGNRNTITNIDTPKNDKELIFSLWYDITRQVVLKTLMPNFALDRVIVSEKTLPAGYVNVYAKCFEYPNYCLKLLGIGDIDITDDIRPTVEGGLIFTNNDYPDGMPLRIIRDITDVTMMSPEFIMALVSELSKRTALSVTQDPTKKNMATKDAVTESMNTSALNAQENKPIRRSVSRFRAARYLNPSHNPIKP